MTVLLGKSASVPLSGNVATLPCAILKFTRGHVTDVSNQSRLGDDHIIFMLPYPLQFLCVGALMASYPVPLHRDVPI